ncbi:hypothetical protein BD769DRAFT_1388635 [Suillus cothurnatus]|nr:hypothetical protein BD769DRAFT_1388635 [Suillus cothurnatus]
MSLQLKITTYKLLPRIATAWNLLLSADRRSADISPPAASQSCSGRVFWGEKVFVHGKIGQEIWRWYWPFYRRTSRENRIERANDRYRSNLAMKISAMLGRRQFAAKVSRSGALEKLEKLSIHDHRHAPSLVWPGRLIEGWFILRQVLNVWGILHQAGMLRGTQAMMPVQRPRQEKD